MHTNNDGSYLILSVLHTILLVMSKFAQRVDIAVDALSSSPPKDVDDNDFIDASRLVYDGVREIRRAVLMNRVRIFHFCGCRCVFFISQSVSAARRSISVEFIQFNRAISMNKRNIFNKFYLNFANETKRRKGGGRIRSRRCWTWRTLYYWNKKQM